MRPHFPNIYAPFCPDCGQPFNSEKAKLTHLAMAHGKRYARYKRCADLPSPNDLARPINVEQIVRAESNAGREIDLTRKWLRDMRRIWRLSGAGHLDLILVEPVRRKPPRLSALMAMCLRIVRSRLEAALTTVPKRMRRVSDYVKQFEDVVARVQEQKRYTRIKSVESRSRLLALALAHPDWSLTRVERETEERRVFRKKNRVLTHA